MYTSSAIAAHSLDVTVTDEGRYDASAKHGEVFGRMPDIMG
jgi:hypothetical protein